MQEDIQTVHIKFFKFNIPWDKDLAWFWSQTPNFSYLSDQGHEGNYIELHSLACKRYENIQWFPATFDQYYWSYRTNEFHYLDITCVFKSSKLPATWLSVRLFRLAMACFGKQQRHTPKHYITGLYEGIAERGNNHLPVDSPHKSW